MKSLFAFINIVCVCTMKLTLHRFLLNFVNDTVVHRQSYKTISTYIEKNKLN